MNTIKTRIKEMYEELVSVLPDEKTYYLETLIRWKADGAFNCDTISIGVEPEPGSYIDQQTLFHFNTLEDYLECVGNLECSVNDFDTQEEYESYLNSQPESVYAVSPEDFTILDILGPHL